MIGNLEFITSITGIYGGDEWIVYSFVYSKFALKVCIYLR